MVRKYIKLSLIGIIIAVIVFIILNVIKQSGFKIEIPKPGNGKVHLDINFQKNFKGIITEKYIDRYNHAYETVDIRLVDSSEYYIPPYGDQYEPFYNYVQVGDSIFKKDWGFKVYIKRDSVEIPFILRSDYNEH